MPQYTASGNYVSTGGATGYYRLYLTVNTAQATGGTKVNVSAYVEMLQSPGIPASQTGTKGYSVPGGRIGSTTGTLAQSVSGDSWNYNFNNSAIQSVYGGFDRYVPYSQGSSITVSVSAAGTGSDFLTSRTVSVNVPLFQQFTVTYDAAGGSTTPAVQNVEPNASFTTASAISRSNYTFAYWLGSNGVIYNAGAVYTMPAANITLTAVWLGNPVAGTHTATANSITFNWSSPISSATGFQIRLGTGTWQSTTSNTYTFSTLNPGQSYTASIRSTLLAGGITYTSTSTSTSRSTLAPATWTPTQQTVTLTTAKIGIPYTLSIANLVNNETSITFASGELPLGITFSNGVFSGSPQQKQQRDTAAEALGFVDQYRFKLSAQGEAGTAPAPSPEFLINVVFPGKRFTSAGQWKELSIARRWDAANQQWVPIQDSLRYTNNTGGTTDITTS